MDRTRVLAIIQAGGAGGRMDVLTRERQAGSAVRRGLPAVDFPLSNLAHSGVTDVWLSVQFLGSSLEEQVSNGRPWDLDRTCGGLRLLMPQEGTGTLDEEGFAKGNADELFRIRNQIADFDPEVVLVLSADHVYRFDYADALGTHRREEAECTIVMTEVPVSEASDHAVVAYDESGRVTGFEYKPDDPDSGTIATEIFLYDPAVLISVLEELHRELSGESDPGDSGLGDFGEYLVPRLVDRGRTVAHAFDGYWRDLGQPHHYLSAHQDVLTDDMGVFGDELADPHPPAAARGRPRAGGGCVSDSMLGPGARVAGLRTSSVLGLGVVVEAGAEVHNSVVFADSVVRAGARVDWSIIDTSVVIEGDAAVGDPEADGSGDSDAVTLVGRGSVVGRAARRRLLARARHHGLTLA